jgi:hypothetical protein
MGLTASHACVGWWEWVITNLNAADGSGGSVSLIEKKQLRTAASPASKRMRAKSKMLE